MVTVLMCEGAVGVLILLIAKDWAKKIESLVVQYEWNSAQNDWNLNANFENFTPPPPLILMLGLKLAGLCGWVCVLGCGGGGGGQPNRNVFWPPSRQIWGREPTQTKSLIFWHFSKQRRNRRQNNFSSLRVRAIVF
jgi:hypothetical protein